MGRVAHRLLVLGALAAAAAGVTIAVSNGLAARTAVPTVGVAAARVTLTRDVTSIIPVAGVRMAVTRKAGRAACYRAPHVASCAPALRAAEISYATGFAGRRQVLGGVAGARVRAVIARLTHGGTVWPRLRHGAFYAVLPAGFRLRAIVKVLPGGRRVSFAAGR